MVRIELTTLIHAPIERCFDLSRSIDLHIASTDGTREQAVKGVTSGLIDLHQEVTWRGRHFGLPVWHRSRITLLDRPYHFQDRMVHGLFRHFCHDHFFAVQSSATVMKDLMEFEAPLAFVGSLAEKYLLRRHMVSLLNQRNATIKKTAESEEWKRYLPSE